MRPIETLARLIFTKEKIRASGLWLINELYKQQSDLKLLARLARRAGI
jgi:hypothetical protein